MVRLELADDEVAIVRQALRRQAANARSKYRQFEGLGERGTSEYFLRQSQDLDAIADRLRGARPRSAL